MMPSPMEQKLFAVLTNDPGLYVRAGAIQRHVSPRPARGGTTEGRHSVRAPRTISARSVLKTGRALICPSLPENAGIGREFWRDEWGAGPPPNVQRRNWPRRTVRATRGQGSVPHYAFSARVPMRSDQQPRFLRHEPQTRHRAPACSPYRAFRAFGAFVSDGNPESPRGVHLCRISPISLAGRATHGPKEPSQRSKNALAGVDEHSKVPDVLSRICCDPTLPLLRFTPAARSWGAVLGYP